jgi:hypothetical protein
MASIFETYIKSSPEHIKSFLIGLLHVLVNNETSPKYSALKAQYTMDETKKSLLESYLPPEQKHQKELLTTLLKTELKPPTTHSKNRVAESIY